MGRGEGEKEREGRKSTTLKKLTKETRMTNDRWVPITQQV